MDDPLEARWFLLEEIVAETADTVKQYLRLIREIDAHDARTEPTIRWLTASERKQIKDILTHESKSVPPQGVAADKAEAEVERLTKLSTMNANEIDRLKKMWDNCALECLAWKRHADKAKTRVARLEAALRELGNAVDTQGSTLHDVGAAAAAALAGEGK